MSWQIGRQAQDFEFRSPDVGRHLSQRELLSKQQTFYSTRRIKHATHVLFFFFVMETSNVVDPPKCGAPVTVTLWSSSSKAKLDIWKKNYKMVYCDIKFLVKINLITII